MANQPDEGARSPSVRNRLRYRFDNLLSRGMWAVLLWLGLITLLAVLFSSLLLALSGVTLSGSEGSAWLEDFWQSLLRVLDPGTMAGDIGWGRRLLALLVTLFGILIAGTLIGLIASGVEQRVEQMRRGRSTVIESGHVVILGGLRRLADVVEQLTLANLGKKNEAIVVLADVEPTELADAVRAAVPDLRGTRLVFRRGDSTRISDLSIVALQRARAVIILGSEDEPGDGRTVRSTLAAGAHLGGFGRIPIIVDLDDGEIADDLVRACGNSVHPVIAEQAVARTTVFALREPGLNQVLAELLDLRGADIHLRNVGDFAGAPFCDIVFAFANARAMGILRSDGRVDINPPAATKPGPDDRLIALADDAGEFERRAHALSNPPNTRRDVDVGLGAAPRTERVIIVGWNRAGTRLLAELDRFCASDSTCKIVYDGRLLDPDDVQIPGLDRLRVTVDPSHGPSWRLGDAQTSNVSAIVLLGYRGALSAGDADSRTLLTLMAMRRELDSRDGSGPQILVELADSDSVDIARVSGADDYVVSDAIASRFMAQLAEQPERRAVLLSLYAEEGPSVHLVRASAYGLAGQVTWDDAVAAVYATGALAIGWHTGDGAAAELRLNPHLGERVTLDGDDQVVVIG